MADYRKALRSAARAALAADDRIGAYRSFLPWVRAVDPQSMPCYCVVVPGEGQRLSAQDGRDASTARVPFSRILRALERIPRPTFRIVKSPSTPTREGG